MSRNRTEFPVPGTVKTENVPRERFPFPGNVSGSTACHAAASGGHLEVLKYLHEKGCPWNKKTCMYAASGGHLEVLKYAIENGCRWGAERIYNIAARNRNFEIIEYVRAIREPLS